MARWKIDHTGRLSAITANAVNRELTPGHLVTMNGDRGDPVRAAALTLASVCGFASSLGHHGRADAMG